VIDFSGPGSGGGAQGRDRTTDTVIFSHVLYQLSYLGAGSGGFDTGPEGARAVIGIRAAHVQI
jgi:hypothetical protein